MPTLSNTNVMVPLPHGGRAVYTVQPQHLLESNSWPMDYGTQVPHGMKVKLNIGATGAYACISTPSKNLDVLLAPGRSAHQALREWAQEQDDKAQRLAASADLARQAADLFETRP